MKRLALGLCAAVMAVACTKDVPTVTLFSAAPASIALGQSTQLFVAAKATTLSIDHGVGAVTQTSVTVTPTATTTYTLTATIGDQTVTATATVTVSPALSAGFTVAKAAAGDPVAGVPADYTITALDSAGAVNANYRGTVHFTSDDAAAVLPADATFSAADAGKHTVPVTLKTAGARGLFVTDAHVASSVGTARVTVAPASATSLTMSGLPSTALAGDRLALVVQARDAYDNVASAYAGTVHFSSTSANAQLPADFTFGAADKGAHAFAAVLTAAGTATLTVADGAALVAGATSSNIAVSHAAPSVVSLAGLEPQVAADADVSFSATVRDAWANVATDYAGTLHFANTDAAATALADVTFTPAMLGVGTVRLQFATAGVQSIAVTDSANPALGGTAATNVTHSETKAYVLSIPATATAGQAITLAITAIDKHGNVDTDYAGTAHVSSGDATDRLPADGKFTRGVRHVALTFVRAGSHTVTVSEVGGTITATSAAVAVSHGAATAVTLEGVPALVFVDTDVAVTTTVRDAFRNPVTDYAGTLHFVLSDPAGTPPADATFTPAMLGTKDVIVRFATAGEQSISATDTVTPSITGSTATLVGAGAATQYVLSGLPSAAVAGEPLLLTIAAVDVHGNVAPGYAGTAHVSSTDATDRLPVDGTFTGGVRTVSLSFVTAGSHTATVSEVGGTITATTGVVLIAPAAAARFVIPDGGATAGVATTATVTAADVFGNQATQYTGAVTLTSSDFQATLPPAGYVFTATDAGQHTFAITLATAGVQRVIATDTAGLTGSGLFSVPAASATACTVVDLPATSAAGAQVGLRVVMKDSFGNVAAGYLGTLAITSSDPAAQVSGAGAFTGTDAGSHAYSVQLRTAGAQTITATDIANSELHCQGTVSVVPGSTLLVVAFTGLDANSDAWAGTPVSATVTAQDAFANVVPTYAGTVAFTSSDALAARPGNIAFVPSDNGQKTVSVTFNSIGAQTLTGTDTVLPAIQGTSKVANVHGLVYTDPAAGGKVRLVMNAANSSATLVQLDLVSNASLFTLSLGTADTVRNGVFAAGLSLPLDTTRVVADATLLSTTVPTTVPATTAALNLGTGVKAAAAALSTANNLLISGVSQKRTDIVGATTTVRGDVAVRPFPGAASYYYSVRLRLASGALPGTIFDGQALGAKFHAAVRDRSGSDVFSNADFAIGKLELR